MEQYKNLPGFYVDVEEDGLQVSASPPITSRVTIIGTSTLGDYFSPVVFSSIDGVEDTFGPYERGGIHNGTTLIPAFKQAYGAGCREIALVRIPHCDYNAVDLKNSEGKTLLSVNSIILNKDEDINDISVEVTTDKLKIWNLAESNKEDGVPVEFSLKSGEDQPVSIVELVMEVNDRFKELGCYLEIKGDVDPFAPAELEVIEKTEASGGLIYELGNYSDSNEKSLRHQLKKAYDYLIDYPTDVIVPAGFSLRVNDGEIDASDVNLLAEFCGLANSRNSRVIGVTSVEELEDASQIKVRQLVEALKDFNNIYEGGKEDLGKFISLTVGDLVFSDTRIGIYSDTGAAAYAGLISTLPPHSATTNKSIKNARGLRYVLYPSQLNELTGNRYITFRERAGAGIVVTDGVTCASPYTDFQRLSTLRIANSVINVTRQVTEPFIGEAMTATKREALNTAVDSGLRRLYEAGAVQQYDFVTYYESQQDMVEGALTIAIAIVPAFEIRKIRLKLSLRPTL